MALISRVFLVEEDVTVGKFSNLPHDGADFPRFFQLKTT